MQHVPRINPRLRRILLVAAVASLTGAAFADDSPVGGGGSVSSGSTFATSGGDPFAANESVIWAALSAGTFGDYGNTFIPPITIGFDFAFHEWMSAGGSVTFSNNNYHNESLTYLTVVGRGTFHPTMWFKRMRIPLDPYGLLILGYSQAFYAGPGSGYDIIVFGPGVGARYWFNSNLAGQAETGIGEGVGLASIGLAYKF